MSGIGIEVDVTDLGAADAVASLHQSLRDRIGLHEAMGSHVADKVREHLRRISISGDRHDSARKLGAQPSGHWGQAVDKTTYAYDAEAATVSVNHPGITRALHDVEIEPESSRYLTIPLVAEAYNKRARSFPDDHLFFAAPGGKDYALLGHREEEGEGVTWFYLLVESVLQHQDRTLLPSDAEIELAAVKAAKTYLDYLDFIR